LINERFLCFGRRVQADFRRWWRAAKEHTIDHNPRIPMPQNDSSNTCSHQFNRARPSVSLRRWLIWIFLAGLVPLLFVVSKNDKGVSPLVTRQQLIELLMEDRIVRGTIHYNPQSSALNEITGWYVETNATGLVEEKRFRLKTRLTDTLEARLLNSGKFEAVEPNNMLLSLFYTLSPIFLVAVLIYFFFIRQIKMAGRAVNPELLDRQLFSMLDRVLIESARQIAKPQEQLFVRMHLSDNQMIEGEILWMDPNYIKYRSSSEKLEFVVPKSMVLKFQGVMGT
jgi:hypothetical protein